MSIVVSFMSAGRLAGSSGSVGIGRCRARETLTLGSGVTTSTAAQEGEIALVHSTEASTILGAKGATPDAAATAASSASDAGFPIPAGEMLPVDVQAGEKLNFKPLV